MIPGSDAGKRRWGFSARERRAILLLLPLLGALVWLVSEALRPRFGDGALLLGDGLAGRRRLSRRIRSEEALRNCSVSIRIP